MARKEKISRRARTQKRARKDGGKLLIGIVFSVLIISTILAGIVLRSPTQTNTQAAITGAPTVVEQHTVSTVSSSKLPVVAVTGGQVYVAWSERDAAQLAQKPEEGGTFVPTKMGTSGDAGYWNTSIAAAPDGTMHYAWIEGREIRGEGITTHVKYKRRLPGQGWSAERVLIPNLPFISHVSTVTNGNTVIALWRASTGYVFTFSNNRGDTWSGLTQMPNSAHGPDVPQMIAAPNGTMYLVWTDGVGVFYGVWTGSNFTKNQVHSGGDPYSASITVSPQGRLIIAFRDVGRGVFLAEQNGATWNVTNPFPSNSVAGPVVVVVDQNSNLHLGWCMAGDGGYAVKYSVRQFGGTFTSPIAVGVAPDLAVNLDMAISVKPSFIFAHMAWERFGAGSDITLNYARVRVPHNGDAPFIPTDTSTPTPTNTPTPTTVPPTSTPQPTATPRPTSTPRPTFTPTPTFTPSPTPTNTPTPFPTSEHELYENRETKQSDFLPSLLIILIIGGIVFTLGHTIF